jgi:hypothetical protein
VLAADARRWDAIAVQAVRDGRERAAIPRLGEDAANDRRLPFMDRDPIPDGARLGGHRVEAIGDVAGRKAIERATFKAT